jgi:hypothetical protein
MAMYLTCLYSLVMCPQCRKHAYAQHSHRTGIGNKDKSPPFRPGRYSSTNVITVVRSQQIPSLFEGYNYPLPSSTCSPCLYHASLLLLLRQPTRRSRGCGLGGFIQWRYANWCDHSLRLLTVKTTKRLSTSLPRVPCSHVCEELTCGRLEGMPQDCTRRARREA